MRASSYIRKNPGRSDQRGLVLIQSQIVSSAVASVDFTRGLSGLYDEYVFELSGVTTSVDIAELNMRYSTDGGSSFLAANYRHAAFLESQGAAPTSAGSGSDSEITLLNGIGNSTGETLSAQIFLHSPSGSLYKLVHFTGSVINTTPAHFIFHGAGTYTGATTAINAVRFLLTSGNISTGKFKLFGVKK